MLYLGLLKLRLPSSSAKFVSNLAYIRNVVQFFIFFFLPIC